MASDLSTESVPTAETTKSASALKPGTVIDGRYEVVDVLGTGGYGIVYVVRDQRLDLEVALKALRLDRNTPAALRRLRREAKAARTVSSHRLVRIHDIGGDDDLTYLTMEWVRGGSLKDYLLRERPSLASVVDFAISLSEGLEALHAAGIVHRDLKPANVLLNEIGEAKLADFGLVRFLEEDEEGSASKAGIGTEGYRAPEQSLGHPVDGKADLYSTGVILFEMLAGRLPFALENSEAKVLAKAPDLRSLRQDVPLWLAILVDRLLAREPADRYPTAAALTRALRARRIEVRRALRRPRILAYLSILILSSVAATIFMLHEPAPIRFRRLAASGASAIVAIGEDGKPLWRREQAETSVVQFALARLSPGARPILATIFLRPHDFSPASRQTLSFIDPDTGAIVREVKLPSAAGDFAGYPDRYFVRSIFAVDFDGDGVDEIVVNYAHLPMAPSYIVLYEPARDRARIVFDAAGGHMFAGAVDIDGDGRKDMAIVGINNGLNWYNAFAAIRIEPPVGAPDTFEGPGTIRSPDMENSEEADLLWYLFLPRGRKAERPEGFHWDPKARRVIIDYGNRLPVAVSYDGFLASDRSPLLPIVRQADRREAWSHYRKSAQLLTAGAGNEAISEARKAVAASESTSDAILTEALTASLAKKLIATGANGGEAQEIMERLVATSENAPELAYDAGHAYHLHGNLDRAVAWYRRILTLDSTERIGEDKNTYIEAIVLALGEQGRWKEAETELQRFETLFVTTTEDWTAQYREFIRWREGQVPRLDDIAVPENATDLLRYWILEFRNARGENSAALLNAVDREIAGHSQLTAPLLSLKAEQLARLGKSAEAAQVATEAWGLGQLVARRSIAVRGHLAIIRDRAKRYAPTIAFPDASSENKNHV